MSDRHSGYLLVYQVPHLDCHGPVADLALELYRVFAERAKRTGKQSARRGAATDDPRAIPGQRAGYFR